MPINDTPDRLLSGFGRPVLYLAGTAIKHHPQSLSSVHLATYLRISEAGLQIVRKKLN